MRSQEVGSEARSRVVAHESVEQRSDVARRERVAPASDRSWKTGATVFRRSRRALDRRPRPRRRPRRSPAGALEAAAQVGDGELRHLHHADLGVFFCTFRTRRSGLVIRQERVCWISRSARDSSATIVSHEATSALARAVELGPESISSRPPPRDDLRASISGDEAWMSSRSFVEGIRSF